MEKEVLLAIKGLQFAVGEEGTQALETITPAEYFMRNGSHYVIYDEVMEGFEENTRNVIKFKDSLVEVTKKGLMNVHMVFEEKKKNMTSYVTPFGNILIGIDTADIKIDESEDAISVNVEYTLDANYEHLADCKIEMNIRSREGGIILQ
ncbi:MAG: DUF1934 domain-containing protein [Lachnospiraceae bacterium]|nr:DUF1934 domain-containing protein [Lachnospiraceae bacterium]